MRKIAYWGNWDTLGYLEASWALGAVKVEIGPVFFPSIRGASRKFRGSEPRTGLLSCLHFALQQGREA